jgi:hypothetical protein
MLLLHLTDTLLYIEHLFLPSMFVVVLSLVSQPLQPVHTVAVKWHCKEGRLQVAVFLH